MSKTSMLHIRIDDKVKAEAVEALANFGLTVSDAVRILLTRVAKEGALPVGLTSDSKAYDIWFRAKVKEAIDSRTSESHNDVMDKAQLLLADKTSVS